MKNIMEQIREAKEETQEVKVNKMNTEMPLEFASDSDLNYTEVETKTQKFIAETISKFQALGRDQIIIAVTNGDDLDKGQGHTQGCVVCNGEFAFNHAMRIIKNQIKENPLIMLLVLKELNSLTK